MKNDCFKINENQKMKLELISKELSKKVTCGGEPLPPADGCGGMCQITCAHYCHATCEGFCGTLSYKA